MYRICSGVGPLRGAWENHMTGLRHTGGPLGQPVEASPFLLPVSLPPCRSVAFCWPAGREIGVAAPGPKSRANE
jgi:hypothetical protein